MSVLAGGVLVAGWFAGPSGLALAVGAALVVALCALFYSRPQVVAALFVALVVVQPGLSLITTPYLGPIKDVLIVAGVVALGMHVVTDSVRRDADAWLIAGAVLLIILYILNPAGSHGIAWFHGARLVIEALLLLLVFYLLPGATTTWRWVRNSVLLVATVSASLGLMQQAIGAEQLVASWGYEWGEDVKITSDGRLRSFGAAADPFNYATVMLLGLVFLACAPPARVWLRRLLFFIIIAGLVASFVRTALLVAVLLGLLVMVRRGKLPLVALLSLVIVLLVGAFAASGNLARSGSTVSDLRTLNGRTELWSRAVPSLYDVFAGRGVGTVGAGALRAEKGSVSGASESHVNDSRPSPVRPITFVDSLYLALIIDVGLIGAIVFMAVLARSLELASRAVHAVPGPAWATGMFVLILLIDGTTRSSLTSVPSGMLLLAFIGLSLAAAEGVQAQRSSQDGHAPGTVPKRFRSGKLQSSEPVPI